MAITGLVPQRYRGMFSLPQGPKTETMFTPQKAYPAAIHQGGEDYDDLMSRYRAIADKPQVGAGGTSGAGGSSFNYKPYTPQTMNYSQTPDVTGAMSQLSNLTRTGGYSADNIADMRARAVSPIRSVYASALRNLDRNKATSGGYSPGYAGATSRMAREQSEQVGGAMTNVNAQLAEAIASGRRSMAPSYASLASSEAGRKTGIESANMDAINRANEGNINRELQVAQLNKGASEQSAAQQMAALQQMQSLYGTTPGLANMFGNQVMQQQSITNANPIIKKRRGSGMSAPMRRAG